MNTIVYLIRHGEIDNPKQIFYGRSINLPLSADGKKQIYLLSKKLKQIKTKLARIYSSPLKRAIQTANILKHELSVGAKIVIVDDLTDVDIPALAGQSIKKLFLIHAQGKDEYDEEFVKKGNEPRLQIAKRMQKVLKKILKQNYGKTAIIVSHGDPLRFLLFKLIHPYEKIPPVSKLTKKDYLKKGEAFRLTFDNNGNILEKKLITNYIYEKN